MKSLRSAGRLLLAVLTMSLFAMTSPSMASEISPEAIAATFDLGMDFDLAPEASVKTAPTVETIYIVAHERMLDVVLVSIEHIQPLTSGLVEFVVVTSNATQSVIAPGAC